MSGHHVGRAAVVGRVVVVGSLNADLVANGSEALAALNRAPYDLVLMDCQMPEMDGYEATRRIREAERAAPDNETPGIPIIALTAHAGPAERERCLAAGMNDHLPKPMSIEDLRTMLALHLPRVRPAGTDEQRFSSLQAALKCGTNCGSCVPELKRLLRASSDNANAGMATQRPVIPIRQVA